MNMINRKRYIGFMALGMGLLMGTANAWYGDPWYRPYGSGAVTYERQNMMRKHAFTMGELADMIEGRRTFNREEAVRLAAELEQGFGDNLIKNFPPHTRVAGSRTLPWAWRDFGVFRGHAEAAKQSSARLGKALAEEPTGQDVQRGGAWAPPFGMRHGPGRRLWADLLSVEAVQEYGRLNATCHSCHALFRGRRW